jgi:predicted nucleic acid-binding protein
MIISDSTTLIILFDLDRVELLSNLFPKVIIPSAVYEEITVKNSLLLPQFISVQEAKECEILETLKLVLDLGESEAIALALELDSKLIIDEKKGRKIAMKQGLEIIGLLGIVYLNIKKEFIGLEEAREFLDDALLHGYRISQKLIDGMFIEVEKGLTK